MEMHLPKNTCCPDGYLPPDLLGVGLVMVLRPLAVWKVRELIISIVEKDMSSCLLVDWLLGREVIGQQD